MCMSILVIVWVDTLDLPTRLVRMHLQAGAEEILTALAGPYNSEANILLFKCSYSYMSARVVSGICSNGQCCISVYRTATLSESKSEKVQVLGIL